MNFLKELKTDLAIYSSKVKWFVFTCIVFFTVGSWIDINGVWCELPIMVHELPEGWRLPSILSATTQMAQIAPMIFLLLKCLFPKRVSYVVVIYIILGIGALSCLLLSFFWKSTVKILNEDRSVGLYVLSFTLGLLDGTSSVTFLPYIGTIYRKEYIIPNYIGESLSAMIPSVLGLIQGTGKDLGCRLKPNTTNSTENIRSSQSNTKINYEDYEPIPLNPNYSVSLYFIFLFILLTGSTISFSFLHFSKKSKEARKMSISPSNDSDLTNFDSTNKIANSENSSQELHSKDTETKNNEIKKPMSSAERAYLLSIIFTLTFIAYGVLPAMQSYSTLPYGVKIFHLSINLSYICLPFVIFLSIWSYNVSSIRIGIEYSISLVLSAYIIAISIMSPCPPLLDHWLGPTLTVFAWVVSTCLFMRVRCCVAARLEECGQKILLALGSCTMFGQMIGGIMMFVLVDTYRVFNDVPECQSAVSFCAARNEPILNITSSF